MISRGLKIVGYAAVAFVMNGTAKAQDEGIPEASPAAEKGIAPQEGQATSPESEPAVEPAAPVRPKAKGAKQGKNAKSAQTPSPRERERSSLYFPDWPAPSFDWSLNPVLGFRYSRVAGTATSQTLGELGVMAGLSGIAAQPGNPGVSLSPHAGYAVGKVLETTDAGSSHSGTYYRAWGGLDVPVIVKFYKHTLGLSYGEIWGGLLSTRRVGGLESDSAVLVLPFLSAHYTFTYERTTASEWNDKLISTYDNWIHARAFSPFLSSFLDVGPGFAVQKTFRDPTLTNLLEARSSHSYLLGLAGADVIKGFLGAEVQAKYVLSSESEATFLEAIGNERSPLDNLGGAEKRLGMPADALYASAFVGLKRVFGNIGVGWRYNLEYSSLGKGEGKKESQGFGLHYAVRF
jgi:hypothetical protein